MNVNMSAKGGSAFGGRKLFLLIPIAAMLAAGCNSSQTTNVQPVVQNPPVAQTAPTPPPVAPPAMQITSPAFADGQSIPQQYTCDGKSLSIPLNFSNVPANAESLAMIMSDPDVPTSSIPSGLYVHWVIFNMPATTTMISENQTPPGIQGNNGSSKAAFAGPCPPDRQHRYFFKLYALDAMLNLPGGSTKDQLEAAMMGHIITQAQLIGLYNKIGNPKK